MNKLVCLKPIMLLVIVLTIITGGCGSDPQEKDQISTDDFQFWMGKWHVDTYGFDRLESLDWKLSGSFKSHVFGVLDNKAIVEFSAGQNTMGDPVEGFSIRYFNPTTDNWIAWLNWPSKNKASFYKMTGQKEFNRFNFFRKRKGQEDTLLIRFSFSDISLESLRWESNVSDNEGKSWYPDGLFLFQRDTTSEKPTSQSPLCDNLDSLKGFIGMWQGYAKQGTRGDSVKLKFSISQTLGSCALWKKSYEDDENREVSLISRDGSKQKLKRLQLYIDSGGISEAMISGELNDTGVTWKYHQKDTLWTENWRLSDRRFIYTLKDSSGTSITKGILKRQR